MSRIRFLVSGTDDPSTRFRVDSYLPLCREAGHDVQVHALPASSSARASLYRGLGDADCVVLLRRLLMPWETRRLRRAVRRLVYEFDDALVYRDSGKRSLTRFCKFAAAVRTADAVVAGNDYLANLARPFRSEVTVVPTVVATDDQESRPADRPDAPPCIGWIGSKSNLPYLRDLGPVLQKLQAEVSFSVLVVADARPELPGVTDVRFVEWSRAAEADFLRDIDIGLMPLRDDAWCRGKCGAKAIQCMAHGVPVVASDVGTARAVVGEGGIVAGSEDEWAAGLRRLLTDASHRRQMGHSGRAHVAAHYSAQGWFERLEAAYLGGATVE